MASRKLLLLFLIAAVCILLSAAQIQDWDWTAASTADAMAAVYQGDHVEDLIDDDDDDHQSTDGRRSLFWRRRYFISYGALSANRVPCPPRSGRSYYTHNCYRARGPVHPYTRGCSCISHCRR